MNTYVRANPRFSETPETHLNFPHSYLCYQKSHDFVLHNTIFVELHFLNPQHFLRFIVRFFHSIYLLYNLSYIQS